MLCYGALIECPAYGTTQIHQARVNHGSFSLAAAALESFIPLQFSPGPNAVNLRLLWVNGSINAYFMNPINFIQSLLHSMFCADECDAIKHACIRILPELPKTIVYNIQVSNNLCHPVPQGGYSLQFLYRMMSFLNVLKFSTCGNMIFASTDDCT